MNERYFQMSTEGKTAQIVVYGDITSWPWIESDVSSWSLSKQLSALPADVEELEVRINSYGGDVAEGVAIYNALKAHKATVTTVCDGFACSIASVIFMAGDKRVMNEASLLMIHNASCGGYGNADDHRKCAEDLETVTGLSKSIYLAATNLDEDELKQWMDSETFINAEIAIERGFATEVKKIAEDSMTQSARGLIASKLTQKACACVSLDADDMCEKVIERLASEGFIKSAPVEGTPPPDPSQNFEESLDQPEKKPLERLSSFFGAIS